MCIHIYLANLLKFIKYAKCGYAWLKMGMDIGLYMWIWWSILVCNYIYIYILGLYLLLSQCKGLHIKFHS